MQNVNQFSLSHSNITENTLFGVYADAQFCTITKSTFYPNYQGGIACLGRYEITNNFLFRNGNPSDAKFGGMRLDTSTTGNRVAHNTLAQNVRAYSAVAPVYAGGLFCNNGIAPNNLLVDNEHGNEQDPSAQKAGSCDFAGSITNESADPYLFIEPYNSPQNFHFSSSLSPAINAGALLLMPITDDFDTNPRTDGVPDVGADEFVP